MCVHYLAHLDWAEEVVAQKVRDGLIKKTVEYLKEPVIMPALRIFTT